MVISAVTSGFNGANMQKCGRSKQRKRDGVSSLWKISFAFLFPSSMYFNNLIEIRKGQFVIEYCGEVISNEVCRKRLEDCPAEDNFYFITLDKYVLAGFCALHYVNCYIIKERVLRGE